MPSGDPNSPPDIRKAKQIMLKIKDRAQASTLSCEEDELDEHEDEDVVDVADVPEPLDSDMSLLLSGATMNRRLVDTGSRPKRRRGAGGQQGGVSTAMDQFAAMMAQQMLVDSALDARRKRQVET